MTRTLRFAALGGTLLLGACNPEQVDTYCRTHTLADVRFSRQSVESLTPTDRRKYLRILEEGAALCGWKPGGG